MKKRVKLRKRDGIKKRGEISLDNPLIDDLAKSSLKKQRNKKFFEIGIMFVLVVIFAYFFLLVYDYYTSPVYKIGIGANIEQVVVSNDGKLAYIKLNTGVNDKNITGVKFIFKDASGKEYNYETTEGIKEISIPFKKSFFDVIFFRKPKFLGVYDYSISSDNTGLSDFKTITDVDVVFVYKTEEGTEVETPAIDTKKPTTPKLTTPFGGGGGGGGSSDGGGGCSANCAGKQCGDDGCGRSCGTCNSSNNETCSSIGQCVFSCSNDLGCNDNNQCTTDTCLNGLCSNIPITCTPSNNCKLSSCNPVNGSCDETNKPDDNPCTISGLNALSPFLSLLKLFGIDFGIMNGESGICQNGICVASSNNTAPILNPIGDKEINEGEVLEFNISATDYESNELNYSAINLPFGADFKTAREFKDRWIMASYMLSENDNIPILESLMRNASELGYTGILLNNWDFYRETYEVGPNYEGNVAYILNLSEELNIEIIPDLINVGSAEAIFRRNPNLIEGILANNTEFVVNNGKADVSVDADIFVANPGFEEVNGNFFSNWLNWGTTDKYADSGIKHSGNNSVRIEINEPGPSWVVQEINVKPHHYYKLLLWIKTENLWDYRTVGLWGPIQGIEKNGEPAEFERWLSWTYWRADYTRNWTEFIIPFNSLDYDKIRIYLGIWTGTTGKMWIDDVSIEDVGLTNVIRRNGTPLSVKNKSGFVYAEGVDFEPIEDPLLGTVPYKGSYEIYHEPPSIILTPNSRISEGEKLLVSFYHPLFVEDGDYVNNMVCLSDPEFYNISREIYQRIENQFHPKTVYFPYGEYRVGNWDEECQKRNMTPGELMADSINRSINIIREVSPQARIYVKGDMFDPYQNAINNYWLVNGDMAGSWNGLSSDVGIGNWNIGHWVNESLPFFANLGHKQVIEGYYDKKEEIDEMVSAISNSKNVPGITGVEHKSWTNKFDDIEYFADKFWGSNSSFKSSPTFSWTPEIGQAGIYNVTFIVSDGVSSDEETITITVKPKGTNETSNETNSSSVILFDFENQSEIDGFSKTNPALEQSLQHVTHGSYSVKMIKTPSDGNQLYHNFPLADWSIYDDLSFDVYNSGDEVKLFMNFQTGTNYIARRGVERMLAANGATTITISFKELRDSGLNLSAMQFIVVFFYPNTNHELYFDNFRFTKKEQRVEFSSSYYDVSEDYGTIAINITRTYGSNGKITVNYTTSDGTAIAGEDYEPLHGTLEWADGDTSIRTIYVNIINNSLENEAKTLSLILSNPNGAQLGWDNQATLEIFDDDKLSGVHISWQNSSKTTCSIAWNTASRAQGKVEYGLTASYGNSVLSKSNAITLSTIVDEAELTGLQPNTTYHYKAGIPEKNIWSQDYTFTTEPAENKEFTFFTGGDPQGAYRKSSHIFSMATSYKPAFLIPIGDVVGTGTVAYWKLYSDFIQEFATSKSLPIMSVPGNHEVEDDPGLIHYQGFNVLPSTNGTEQWYSFDYSNAHFIILQSTCAALYITSEQAKWLESDLNSTNKTWKIVFFHCPPFSSGYMWNGNARNYFSPTFYKYHVNLVFSGHVHLYERSKPIIYNLTKKSFDLTDSYEKGTGYITVGPVGEPLKATNGPNWWTEVLKPDRQNVAKVTVTKDALLIEAIDRFNNVFDEFTITNGLHQSYVLKVNNGNGSGTYNLGELVNITANPLSCYYFTNWSGDVEYVADPTEEKTSTAILGDAEITANFALGEKKKILFDFEDDFEIVRFGANTGESLIPQVEKSTSHVTHGTYSGKFLENSLTQYFEKGESWANLSDYKDLIFDIYNEGGSTTLRVYFQDRNSDSTSFYYTLSSNKSQTIDIPLQSVEDAGVNLSSFYKLEFSGTKNIFYIDNVYFNYKGDSINESEYPRFSNYSDNSGTLMGGGIALFNATVENTNGSVFLNINNQDYPATNLSSNIYNVSVNLTSDGDYSYYWFSYGTGMCHQENISNIRNYAVNYQISNCGILSSAGLIYTLIADINNNTITDDCMKISAQNITLDCNGHSITSTQNYSGVYSNQHNTIVKNCNIRMGTGNNSNSMGIEMASTNNLIYNNTIIGEGMYYGIYLSGASNNNLTNNNVNVSSVVNAIGIYLTFASNNNLDRNNATASTGKGIWLYYNNNHNILTGNTGTSNSSYGIYINQGSINNTLTNNIGISNSGSGIGLISNNETLTGNTGTSISGYGIYLNGNSGCSLTSNTGTSNSSVGIYLGGGSHNLTNNTGTSNSNAGIFIYSSNNILINNIATSNSYAALYFYGSSNNVLINQNATGYLAGSYGIYFFGNSGNIIQDCIQVLGVKNDVYTFSGTNNTFINCSYTLSKETVIANQWLTRKWYYQAYVNDSSGTAVANSNVSAYNVSGGTEFEGLMTNSLGWTNITTITDYVNVGGTRRYYSNYTINATKLTYVTSHSYNFSLGNNLNDVLTFNENLGGFNSLKGSVVDIINWFRQLFGMELIKM